MNNPTILLTGGTGFLGSKILEALVNQDYSVVLLKRSTSKLWRINHLLKRIKTFDADRISLDKVFKEQKIDIVIHTACEYGRMSETLHHVAQSNIIFSLKVLDACLKYDIKTFINTDTLLPRNLNAYTLSKKQFFEWLKEKSDQIQIINIKIDLIYGTKDDTTKFIPWVITQIKKNVPKIKFTKGEQERDFIFVDDVVSAFMIILKKSPNFQNYNEFDVGTGEPIKIRVFLECLKKIYISNFGEIKTKFVYGEIPYRPNEMMAININNKPLNNLGWSPKINLQQGLRKILKE